MAWRELKVDELDEQLGQALWKIYRRTGRPAPWQTGGNLPWNDPDFSERMLREHLDESHSAASRVAAERSKQIDWMWDKLALQPGARILDLTCGPGLYAVEFAGRGCEVVGVDFGPASVTFARNLAKHEGVADRCTFLEQDVRETDYRGADFDAALFIYGQITVFTPDETQTLLNRLARSLRPGGKLVLEILDRDRIDKEFKSWWYTGDWGLWGDRPYLHLGERIWYPEEQIRLERFLIVHLETGELTEVQLCDQSYSAGEMSEKMQAAGFKSVEVYLAWDGLSINDAQDWVIFVGET